MIALLTRFLALVFSLLLIAELVPGIRIEGFTTALIIALVLAVFNVTLKPLLFVLTLPITLITLGLFAFVLNALILWFVASFVEGFVITGFLPALLGALIMALVNWLVSKLI